MHATQPAIVTQLTLTPRSLVPAKRCILDAYRHRQSLQSPRLPLGQLARPYHPAPCLFTATTSPIKALPCSLPCPVQCSISIVNCRDASARARGDDRPYQPPKLPLTQLQSTFNQQACHNRHPRTSTIGVRSRSLAVYNGNARLIAVSTAQAAHSRGPSRTHLSGYSMLRASQLQRSFQPLPSAHV